VNLWQDSHWDITAQEAHRRQSLGEVELIDVREGYEWEAGRAAGSRHVEIERLASRAREVPRDRAVAFLCLGGVRSAMVAHAFRSVGYEAYNVAGGFRAWVAAQLPTEPGDAAIAPH
jgi:rhodanese-related sulfurtransferase